MIAASARRSVDLTALAPLTERHRNLKIQPQHYEIWMQSLIQAVEECDRYFNPEVGRVWREAFRAGIAYMQSGAESES
jgi:hemoglobin-like flavoprotein